jgi:hypothetical protein
MFAESAVAQTNYNPPIHNTERADKWTPGLSAPSCKSARVINFVPRAGADLRK